jgi:hypothetical protein
MYAIQHTHKIQKQISTEQNQSKNKRFMHLSKQKIKIFFKKHEHLNIKGHMLPFHVWIKFSKYSNDVSCLKWLGRSFQVYLVNDWGFEIVLKIVNYKWQQLSMK